MTGRTNIGHRVENTSEELMYMGLSAQSQRLIFCEAKKLLGYAEGVK